MCKVPFFFFFFFFFFLFFVIHYIYLFHFTARPYSHESCAFSCFLVDKTFSMFSFSHSTQFVLCYQNMYTFVSSILQTFAHVKLHELIRQHFFEISRNSF